MSDRKLTKVAVLSVALTASLALAGRAVAVTNGTVDGNAHPNVGVLVADVPGAGPQPICSGTLIAPAVFLTAAHCTAWMPAAGINRVSVAFDSTLDAGRWTLHSGVFRTDPAYGHDLADLHDLAVILLDEPVAGIAPATLPRAGAVERLRARTELTSVGYGFHTRATGGGQPQFLYDGARRTATSPVASVTSSWLRLLTSSAATGNGGTCFGDSGGPQFLGDSNVLVGVTSRGDAACAGIGWSYRLDTPSARSFLGRFVALP